jgi:hypothetical protein
MTLIQVKDGNRLLQFDGRLIGTSTSWRRGSYRWVEFKLYKTHEEGRYILSRVGMSLLYHLHECAVVERNNLKEAPRSTLDRDARPCEDCRPDQLEVPIVCPEKPRYWAQVCDTPDAVIKALYKEDENGNTYLTFVAQRLLENAADLDTEIEGIYRIETIH